MGVWVRWLEISESSGDGDCDGGGGSSSTRRKRGFGGTLSIEYSFSFLKGMLISVNLQVVGENNESMKWFYHPLRYYSEDSRERMAFFDEVV